MEHRASPSPDTAKSLRNAEFAAARVRQSESAYSVGRVDASPVAVGDTAVAERAQNLKKKRIRLFKLREIWQKLDPQALGTVDPASLQSLITTGWSLTANEACIGTLLLDAAGLVSQDAFEGGYEASLPDSPEEFSAVLTGLLRVASRRRNSRLGQNPNLPVQGEAGVSEGTGRVVEATDAGQSQADGAAELKSSVEEMIAKITGLDQNDRLIAKSALKFVDSIPVSVMVQRLPAKGLQVCQEEPCPTRFKLGLHRVLKRLQGVGLGSMRQAPDGDWLWRAYLIRLKQAQGGTAATATVAPSTAMLKGIPTVDDCMMAASKAGDARYEEIALQAGVPGQSGRSIAALALTSRDELHADRFRISGPGPGKWVPCSKDEVVAVLTVLHGMKLGLLRRRPGGLLVWERFLTPEEEKGRQMEETSRGRARWREFQKKEEKHWFDIKARLLQEAGAYDSLDADGDGQVSLQELEKANMTKALDTNKDGRVSSTELKAARF